MKLENLDEFMPYSEAKQRWLKNPNSINAGFALASSFRLIDAGFIEEIREEGETEEDSDIIESDDDSTVKVPVDADDHNHITIEAYMEWLHFTGRFIADMIEEYENKKGKPIRSDDIEQPYVTLSVLPGREIPAKLMYTMILADMDIVLANNLFKRTWATSWGNPFEYAYQLMIANPTLIAVAEYDRDHKDKGEENGN